MKNGRPSNTGRTPLQKRLRKQFVLQSNTRTTCPSLKQTNSPTPTQDTKSHRALSTTGLKTAREIHCHTPTILQLHKQDTEKLTSKPSN
ncbi:unnamed protein product [Cyprideis torosa]|uniref:Uncharacterized protein n=1 Tax=Cyprideis torosa TaxID=163714 RepID=A0A7R8W6F0_9CRUS|nr:unnamed protein product [Cyprideis torosa]CAG0886446.1 unnamed protein product [Cyprideis torosa]